MKTKTVRPDVDPLVQDIAVLAVPRKPTVPLTGQAPKVTEDELTLQQANCILSN